MMFSSVIEIGRMVEKIEHGEVIKDFNYKKRFANKMSIRSTEFYNSAQIGLKPELCFEVRSEEYENEVKLKYKGLEYTIIRTYDNQKKGTVEIYAQKEEQNYET